MYDIIIDLFGLDDKKIEHFFCVWIYGTKFFLLFTLLFHKPPETWVDVFEYALGGERIVPVLRD